MAKNITYFDREHTGGINLAAMEDTQLKENLVQDVAAGGDEAPTATAVKEAVDAKIDKTDIINDLTTGGADKALSAEQGKVLDGKKVDKVTTPDSVYVTEGSKPLSEFVVDADIINDRTTGGVDKVLAAEVGKDIPAFFNLSLNTDTCPLTAATIDSTKFTDNVMSMSTMYIHPDEIPADIKNKLKKGDIIYTVSANSLFNCSASFIDVIATAGIKGTNATEPVVNTSLPASGNWEGWYAFAVLASGWDRSKTKGKTNAYITYLFDGDETLETLPDSRTMISGGFAYSVVYIKPEDIKANRYNTNIPATYLKQVDGSTLKPGDILAIETPNTAEATKKVRAIHCLITHTAASTNSTLGVNVLNTKLPAAGNWGGWLVGRILASGWDREAMLAKSDSTKVQSYFVELPVEGKTFASMPDLINFNSDKGTIQSNLFVHPDDITNISSTLKKGDTVLFLGKDSPTGKAIGPITAIYAGYITDGAIPNDDVTLNVTDPDDGNFAGWYAFTAVSSGYGRVQIGNKVSQYDTTAKMISADTTPETAATLTGCDVRGVSNKAISYVFVKPEELGITEYKPGASVVVNISAALAKQKVTIEGWLGAKVSDGSALFDGLALNTKLPASGNWNGFCRINIRSIDTNAAVINSKSRNWSIIVRATDQQFLDTWRATKTRNIEDKTCPMQNFMLTKDMMAQMPNAKVGDTIYLVATTDVTNLPYNIYLYGILHSLAAVPSSQSATFYPYQDNSGDVSGCGTMLTISGNFLSALVQRKPNFFQIATTATGSNIPYGLKSATVITFAPSDDTASIADALKTGDLINVTDGQYFLYTLQFVRYAINADLGNVRGSIVGQATEPADVTGYLICIIISSIYDKTDNVVFETARYNPSQFDVGNTYSINIKPSAEYDRILMNGETIDIRNVSTFNNAIRLRFEPGTIFKLWNPSITTEMYLLVETNTYAADNRIVAKCITKGSTNIVRL